MKNLTNDHRIRVTKMLIRRAFTDLLRQKPIQSISVKELCEKAGINRGTFYSHYADLYDLRRQMEDEMRTEFEKALEALLEAGPQQVTPIKVITELFQCLKDNSDLCVVTLGDYGDKDFLLKMLNYAREKTMESYSKHFRDASPKKIEYFYAFASSGCIGLLRKWLEDGLTSSAEEIASIAENIMMQGIRFLQPDKRKNSG